MSRKKRPATPATERILAAAGTMIARHGYGEATFDKIARQAGVSRGLLHYHFNTKEQMFAQVLDRNMEQAIALMQDVLAQSRSARQLTSKMVQTFAALYAENPRHFALFLEGLGTARHSRLVRKVLSHSYCGFRGALRSGLQDMVDRGALVPVLPVKVIATTYMSILDGTSLALATVAGAGLGDDFWHDLERGLRALLVERAGRRRS